jgi:localization factor PodJL
MSNLAVAYAEGDGTAKNPQEAGRWFLKAAQLGLPDAQFDLAILYERGLGVPQNLTDAYRWYVIAAKAGDKESKDRVDALSSQLTAEDRAAAETAAAEFKPLPMNARANEQR